MAKALSDSMSASSTTSGGGRDVPELRLWPARPLVYLYRQGRELGKNARRILRQEGRRAYDDQRGGFTYRARTATHGACKYAVEARGQHVVPDRLPLGRPHRRGSTAAARRVSRVWPPAR